MRWRNWFWPAYFWRKRSRSASPERKRARSSDSRRTLISIARHELAEFPFRTPRRADAIDHRLAGAPRYYQPGAGDDVRRQLMECLEVVAEGFLDEMPLLDPRRPDVLLQEFLGRRGHQGRNLRFLLHILSPRSKIYILVEHRSRAPLARRRPPSARSRCRTRRGHGAAYGTG